MITGLHGQDHSAHQFLKLHVALQGTNQWLSASCSVPCATADHPLHSLATKQQAPTPSWRLSNPSSMIPVATYHTRQCLLLLKMEATSGASEKKQRREFVSSRNRQPPLHKLGLAMRFRRLANNLEVKVAHQFGKSRAGSV